MPRRTNKPQLQSQLTSCAVLVAELAGVTRLLDFHRRRATAAAAAAAIAAAADGGAPRSGRVVAAPARDDLVALEATRRQFDGYLASSFRGEILI